MAQVGEAGQSAMSPLVVRMDRQARKTRNKSGIGARALMNVPRFPGSVRRNPGPDRCAHRRDEIPCPQGGVGRRVRSGACGHARPVDDDICDGAWPGRGWISVTPGAHVRETCATDLAARLRAWQLVLPFWSAFSGLTAAQLRGWWLPPVPAGLPLFVASGRSDRIDRRGVRACRHDVLQRWELVDGVRTSSPAETVLACARDLGLLDVVLIGDAALQAGHVTREQLISVSRLRRRGAPLLRRAIPLMDDRAESIFEGLLRMLHRCCGIDVEPQHVVVAEDGSVVARGDLLLVGTRMLHELDGGHHRSPSEQRQDLRRHRRLLTVGYERRGFTAQDVLLAPIGILRDADATIGREHDPARITAWYSLVKESLFTPSGQQRLRLRLSMNTENAEQTPS